MNLDYLWSVQSREVITQLLSDLHYYPDIDKSKGYNEMKCVYPALLESFNYINRSSHNGLIFAFYKQNGAKPFQNVDDLYDYLLNNIEVSRAFNFWKADYVILKIKIDININIMPLDFNDVIKLSIGKTKDIERIKLLYSSIESFNIDIKNIIEYMNSGNINPYTIHKSFIEGHYPYLKLEDIENIYSNLDLKECEKNHSIKMFNLFEEAKILQNLIIEKSHNF